MGGGDATGTLSVNGAGEHFVATEVLQLARTDRWQLVSRRDWQELSPATLAERLRASNQPTEDEPALLAGPEQKASHDRPPGVPENALHADVGSGRKLAGTVWFAAEAPHRVLGYSGGLLPSADGYIDDPIPIALAATEGTSEQAATTYKSMAADLATVTGHSITTQYYQRPVVRAILSGNLKSAGSCLVRFPLVAPGAKTRGRCDVDDKRIDPDLGQRRQPPAPPGPVAGRLRRGARRAARGDRRPADRR